MESEKLGAVRKDVTVNFNDVSEESSDGVAVLTEQRAVAEYTPVKHHWFYRVDLDNKSMWRGFSIADSRALEEAFHSANLNENTVVATDGGRYDVNIVGRLRVAVYWADKPTNVRRCSWFYKGTTDPRYVPYSEAVAEKLEEEYRHGITTGEWHRRLILPNNESVVMHGPGVMVHLLQSTTDGFSSTPQSTIRPRVVRRGWDETEIEDTEPSSIDHLLLLCHGVGSVCDMRLRSVEKVVDDFRATSLQLLQSHYRNSYDNGIVNRIEVLPISWHSTLHSSETGVDRRLAQITLDSIPKLRNFTNDTVLDVLFYTSPVFCQTILDTVCTEINRVYNLFSSRNPGFKGSVSLGGHSLGSVILYDLLCHQTPDTWESPDKRYVSGPAGTGQASVRYPRLDFSPATLYALGSPIAMFECIRGVESLGGEFALPTCKNFFNIFHPYDPIAYRIEPLINPQLRDVKPFLIPHHKGRKRMHLELKDTMARVGADLKQKLIESLKSTWSNMWRTQSPPTDGQLEKVVEEEMEKEQLCEEIKEDVLQDDVIIPDSLGKLNCGRRVDYVLQEAPFEMINEYLFAMSSHVCYWESEDTMLLILREIYSSLGVQPDCTVPQQSMTVQRTRPAREEETIVMNAAEHPSTSRGET
ncbi:SEC23-interacting protein-like [Aphomia sociella]